MMRTAARPLFSTAGLCRLVALASFCTFGAGDSGAAMLQLAGGDWQSTPAQVPGNVTAGNDVIPSPVNFWDNATLTTNAPVVLTFYYVGAEAGFANRLNVTGGGTHLENDLFPGNWSNSPLFSVTLGAGQSVPMFFTSSGFSGSLLPGGGIAVSGGDSGDFNRSIGFSILSCTTGAPACFSSDQNLRTGDVIAFMLDDGGANVDDNHDDYVGYMVASAPPVPLPAAGWLLLSGLGALGFTQRRKTGRNRPAV